MSYPLSELDRQVSGMIIAGYVSAVQLKPPRVRVMSDDWESCLVPWFAFAAGKARHWRPPSVGEQAVLLSPSGDPAQAFALVGYYTAEYPGDGRENVTAWLYPDGAVWEHDHAAGRTVIRVPASGGIDLACGASSILMTGAGIKIQAPRLDLNEEG